MANISTAMVLAAGFGKRLRPITDTTPKPLVPVGNRTMLDRTFDTLLKSGINNAVVNTHYLGDQIKAHCDRRTDIATQISDESDEILETGGGTVKALSKLGEKPFVLVNADTFWVDFGAPNLSRMVDAFDETTMDILLLVCTHEQATGHSGGSDFSRGSDGRLKRTASDNPDGLIYAGAAIYAPHIFDDAPLGPHSLNIYFDRAIARNRLFGTPLIDGHWFTVGTPEGLDAAESQLATLVKT